MNAFRFNTVVKAAVLSTALLSFTPSVVEAKGIADFAVAGDKAGSQGDWANAYTNYKEATEVMDKNAAIAKFGDSMGYLWYRRGQGAMILGQKIKKAGGEGSLEKALVYLEDSVMSFGVAANIGKNTEKNVNRNKANYNQGQVYMDMLKFDDALKSFDLFKKQYNSRNPEEASILSNSAGSGKGRFILERSVCLLRKEKPDLNEGKKGLAWIMTPENKKRFKVPDSAIFAGFKALCDAIKVVVVEQKGERKAVMKIEGEFISFINENRGLIKLSPYLMYDFNPFLLKTAIDFQAIKIGEGADAKAVGLDKAAFALMSFIPNTTVSEEDMMTHVDALGDFPAVYDHFEVVTKVNIESDIKNLKDEVKKGVPQETKQNIIMAKYYEEEGNSLGSFGIFEMMELYHPDHPRREEWLYNLVRSAYNIGEIDKTVLYGERYKKVFPKGEFVSQVEEFMLASLFKNGRYDDCIRIASLILPKLKEGTKQHDIALYCLGGSFYYKGMPEKAEQPLAKHVATYSGKKGDDASPYIVSTSYWSASNDIYLYRWSKAATKLDAFLAKYPTPAENPYFAIAKYDRANCYSNLDQPQESIDTLKVVIKDFSNSPVIAQSYTLRGNNHYTLQLIEPALNDYVKGLALAKAANQAGVEEEVLNYLVTLLGDASQPDKVPEQKAKKMANFKKAAKYYDEFWKKFSKGPYKSYVAVAGIEPLQALGRGEEALQNLKEVIIVLAKEKDAFGMEKAVNTYTDKYLAIHNNDSKKLEEHYSKDFRFRADQLYARSLVKMSLVGAYELLSQDATRNKDEPAAKKWKRAVQVQLNELEGFPIDKMNNYTLVKIADNIKKSAKTTAQFKGAVTFYNRVITNAKTGGDKAFNNEAMFGLADILIKTGDKSKMKEALKNLNGLRASKTADPQTKNRAFATYIQLSSELGEHQVATTEGEKFVKENRTSPLRGAVRLAMADSYEALGNNTRAIENATSIIINNKGNLSTTGPQVERILRLQTDKFKAYIAGYKFVKPREASFEKAIADGKMTNSEIESWNKIKSQVADLKKLPVVQAGIQRLEREDAIKNGK